MTADSTEWQEDLPPEIRALLVRGEAVTIGRSGMSVWHVEQGYLKVNHQEHATMSELAAEKDRLQWLQGRLPVPQVYAYGSGAKCEYLYMSEIPGVMACDQRFREDMPSLIALIAEALHMVHALPQEQCPFSRSLHLRLEQVQQKIVSNRIDETLFLRARGVTPQAWYRQLEQIRPTTDALTFAHGDFCLPNILIDPHNRRISGIIDWGRGGIADRHEDIDSACWSLGYNFDPAWIPHLKIAYGEELIDAKTLAFYELFSDLASYIKQDDNSMDTRG